jgi:puromycin-sensitive aminopeptidase
MKRQKAFGSISSILAVSASLSAALLSGPGGLSASYAKNAAQIPPVTAPGSRAEIVKQEDSNRLSQQIVPTSYVLSFEPDLKKFTFAGTEKIRITVKSQTQSIALNGLEMKILKATLGPAQTESASGSESETAKQTKEKGAAQKQLEAKVDYNTQKEQIRFSFNSPIAPGEYELDCQFTGILNDQLRGFYRSSYVDEKGRTHWLATTQMEPTDARRMFPCFDEPDFKATYQITAIIDSQFVAISNSPIAEEKSIDGKKVIRFEPTPKMSTYLVALIVGDLKCTGTKNDANNVPISVWTTPGKEHLGKFALDIACEILPAEASYFGIPYPGKKLDLIALPDFDAGAMENIGAITFREARLLVDEKTGTKFLKRHIASIEAHEIAHQWFGDLVTMKWWDDLWLNEAFATWMATKTVETVRPDWRSLANSINSFNTAKEEDQLQSTRAIHADVKDPSQAVEMFDTITYEKGSGILRMLECFVGEKTFQQGIHDYLTAHSYSNATTEDLWTAIASASGGRFAVPQIMKSWVYQAGFPLVRATLQPDGKAIKLQQTRFFEAADAKPTKQVWQVPVVFNTFAQSADCEKENQKSEEVTADRKLLSNQQDIYSFHEPQPESKPPFANKNGTGFYRVQYPQADFDAISNKFAALSAEEKLIFLSDAQALAIAGKVPVENALKLMLNVRTEKDPLVQLELISGFYLPKLAINASTKDAYAKLIQDNLSSLKKKLGWQAKEGEPELNKDVRNSVLMLLGSYGQDKQTIDEAFKLFHQYLKNHAAVNPDVVPSILHIVSFNGGTKDYQDVVGAWKSSKNPEDEKRFLTTLASFNKPDLIAKTLNLSLSPEVRGQDATGVLGTMLARKESQEQAWSFTKAQWSGIVKRFPEMGLRHIPASCSTFYTRKAEQDLRAFFAAHKVPYASARVARTLESVHINVLFQERDAAKVRAWVKAQAAKS